MTRIRYVIEVTYPPSTTEEDTQEHLEELVELMDRYGMAAEGWIEEASE